MLKTGSVAHVDGRFTRERIAHFLRRRCGRRRTAPVRVIAQKLPADEIPRLYAAADAYVSASRGEAWGRPYMEAMAMGLPTIGTRFGGNLEFMSDANSWLVDGKLVPVPGRRRRRTTSTSVTAGSRPTWTSSAVRCRRLPRTPVPPDARRHGRAVS